MSKNAWSPGPDQPVGEVVRVRVAALAGDRVDRLDLVGAHLVEPLVRQRDDLVLPDAGLQRLDDVLVDAVDHRRGLVEQHDLVAGLDLARVEHQLLGVADVMPAACELEQHRRLDDVHAEGHVGHALLAQDRLDLRAGRAIRPDVGRDRAPQAVVAAARRARPSSQGEYMRGSWRADPKSQSNGSPVRVSSAQRSSCRSAHSPMCVLVSSGCCTKSKSEERPALAGLQRLARAREPVVAQPLKSTRSS